MQQQAWLPEFLVQNSLSAPTQVFSGMLVWSTPSPVKIWPGLGTWDLSWSGVLPPPPPPPPTHTQK